MNTIDGLFSYLESFTNLEKNQKYSGRTYRLDRMYTLLDMFQNPHCAFKTIHVAGTKGKGSTAAFIASVLKTNGFRTGLYTSPHVSSYCERITVNQDFPDSRILLSIGKTIKEKVSELHDFHPTTFELLTLLAFCYFRETACEYVVAEVGIGGRLDATNVICPLISVITPIDIEHTDVLGNTLPEIAREKAGIIKQGIPVFSGIQQEPVKQVIKKVSDEKKTTVIFLDEVIVELDVALSPGYTLCKLKLEGRERISFSLSMPGEFQAENASLAYIALTSLFPAISPEKVKAGFISTKLPGRFEIIGNKPVIVLDGAHTPLAVSRVLSAFQALYPGKAILIFGSAMGKNHEKMSAILAPYFHVIIISTPGYFKESDPHAVYKAFKAKNKNTILIKEPRKALFKALRKAHGKLPVLVTGSFYMVAEIRRIVL
ncbi:MAG: bifunctional folylpolyglutamate synthase/dihydrofolate synthase [Spirochaetales bacterium]|nr:bifunctional folylpolyglutamate synthase/dihydrofolate synthase [Spirochaetales bacterium]